jgi:YD repeat-containing protein
MLTATMSSGTTTYTYDYQNQLTNVEINGTVVATYTYDALGHRIGIKDNGTQTWTVYNGNSADANAYRRARMVLSRRAL